MCGIAGFWQAQAQTGEKLAQSAWAMTQTLVHRGPNDGGIWLEPEAGLGLCHRRLSILDLSSAGHQPMISQCGRFVLVFNGEIYNFQELRQELQARGRHFRGTSDTEVLLEGVAEWGGRQTLKKLNGMFAFAVWDRKERTLTLARDHIGIKPLYYGWSGSTFLFGSELKAIRAHPFCQSRLDRQAVGLFLKYNYLPAPFCIWEDFHKLPAGHALTLEAPDQAQTPEAYWSAERLLEAPGPALGPWAEHEAAAQLEQLLRDSIRRQMVADVPLGAFLSGGIDSSTVVALMQSQVTRRVKTFTIGFQDDHFNEAKYAAQVARHLGTEHHELYASPQDALALIPRLPAIFDEPFADASQIPTCLVAELTKRHVTVSLSGDGGDELFAGYSHYAQAQRRWHCLQLLPSGLRAAVGHCLSPLEEPFWDRLLDSCRWLFSPAMRQNLSGHKVRRLIANLQVNRVSDFYDNQVSKWLFPPEVIPGAQSRSLPFSAPGRPPQDWDAVQSMAYFDLLNYLPEDVLTKVDRTSMAVSLEARVPLLDHRVVEFALRLPMSLKIRERQGKWLLRQVLYKYVPREMVERPKMGFRVPVGTWLRGPLREWAEELLSMKALEESGCFNSQPVRRKWQEHLDGKHSWEDLLWSVLMFQAWRKLWN